MDHPLYSFVLAPCDFWLFPKLKKCPEGAKICWPFWHQTQRETLLRGILENDFQDCFRQWQHRLTKFVASRGDYFEGDSIR